MVMERLTSSPNIMDIYGFCGMSTLSEYATGKIASLSDKKKGISKLKLAIEVAKGLAALHGIDGSKNITFVHNDLNPSNILLSRDGVPKINDFNIGILMTWNKKNSKPCGFLNCCPNAQWRAPEEMASLLDGERSEHHLTNKIDIYALGNIFFRMIVGKDVWRSNDDKLKGKKATIGDANIIRKKINGQIPPIPRGLLDSEKPGIVAIREVMLDSFLFKPERRPTAQSIVQRLEESLLQYKKRMEKKSRFRDKL
mmetsp:Transcript_40994/g.49259  ORF Transcript_40994/g.49259 Transcript_40994/m.49259 type:complete len:254 (-) Transcript_40994:76-837(-)